MGNRKSKLRSKERVSQWRIENLFHGNAVAEAMTARYENRNNYEDFFSNPLEDVTTCNLSNFESYENGTSKEQTLSFTEKCSNLSAKSTEAHRKQRKISRCGDDKNRVRFAATRIPKPKRQKNKMLESHDLKTRNCKNKPTKSEEVLIKKRESMHRNQKQEEVKNVVKGDTLNIKKYGVRLSQLSMNKTKCSRPSSSKIFSHHRKIQCSRPSLRRGDVKNEKLRQTASSPFPSLSFSYPRQVGIKPMKIPTKNLLRTRRSMTMNSESTNGDFQKSDQSVQCNMDTCDYSHPALLSLNDHNTPVTKSQKQQSSEKRSSNEKKFIFAPIKTAAPDEDAFCDYLHRGHIRNATNLPRNVSKSDMDLLSDMKLFDQSVSHTNTKSHSMVKRNTSEYTSKSTASGACISFQTVEVTDKRGKPGLRRLSKASGDLDYPWRSNDNSQHRRRTSGDASIKLNGSKKSNPKGSFIPKKGKDIKNHPMVCTPSEEEYSQFTATEDEVTFPSESCGRIKSPLPASYGDIKAAKNCDSKELKSSALYCTENMVKDDGSNTYFHTDNNSSCNEPADAQLSESSTHYQVVKRKDNKYTIIEVKNNIEQLKRWKTNNRAIFCHRFLVKVNADINRLFTDSMDRRIESICRQSCCRIHVKRMHSKKRKLTNLVQILIFAESLRELEKCCKLFDYKFPSFKASCGLGLKR